MCFYVFANRVYVLRHTTPVCLSVSQQVLRSLVASLLLTQLNYGMRHTTMVGLPSSLNRLQSVMNIAERLVFSARKSEHITAPLRDLHWLGAWRLSAHCARLPLPAFLHCSVIPNLACELYCVADINSQWRLRSASTSTLDVPSTCHATIGDRVFDVAAALIEQSAARHRHIDITTRRHVTAEHVPIRRSSHCDI